MLKYSPRVNALNNSKEIIFKSIVFGEILIDKVEQKIINNGEDITDLCRCKFCDSVFNYNLATICYKILQNKTDKFCREYLLNFDKVILK